MTLQDLMLQQLSMMNETNASQTTFYAESDTMKLKIIISKK